MVINITLYSFIETLKTNNNMLRIKPHVCHPYLKQVAGWHVYCNIF